MKIYVENEKLLRKVVYGLVGPSKGVEFMEFFRINKKFDNILDMMRGKVKINIPEANDQLYALCASLIYHVWRGEDDKDAKLRLDGFFNIVEQLRPEFIMMTINGAMYGNGRGGAQDCAKRMISHPKYKTTLSKYKSLASKHVDL